MRILSQANRYRAELKGIPNANILINTLNLPDKTNRVGALPISGSSHDYCPITSLTGLLKGCPSNRTSNQYKLP
jgi:hypothetical protein